MTLRLFFSFFHLSDFQSVASHGFQQKCNKKEESDFLVDQFLVDDLIGPFLRLNYLYLFLVGRGDGSGQLCGNRGGRRPRQSY